MRYGHFQKSLSQSSCTKCQSSEFEAAARDFCVAQKSPPGLCIQMLPYKPRTFVKACRFAANPLAPPRFKRSLTSHAAIGRFRGRQTVYRMSFLPRWGREGAIEPCHLGSACFKPKASGPQHWNHRKARSGFDRLFLGLSRDAGVLNAFGALVLQGLLYPIVM